MKKKAVQLMITFALLCLSVQMRSQRCEVINSGVSGNTTVDLLKRLEVDVIQKTPDLVLIMAGTNDMLNSQKMIGFKDYKQNLRAIISELLTNGVSIVLLSPPPVDTLYLFERHKKEMFQTKPNEKIDSAGAIMEVLAKEYKVGFIDIYQHFKNINVPKHNSDIYIKNQTNSNERDGVHPTAIGYRYIAETIEIFLRDQNLLSKKCKIICFGDSITLGKNVTGEGTVSGSTYPAFLNKMINK